MRSICIALLLLLTNTCMAQENGIVNWDVNGTIVNMYFDLGSAALTPATKTTLDSLVYNDMFYKGRSISLLGYADMTGGEAANKILSYKRAKAIAAYLHSMGVDTTDINYLTGYGEITRKDNIPQRVDRKVTMVIAQPPVAQAVKWEDTGRLVATVMFTFGEADVQNQSRQLLDTVTAILKRKPNMRVRLNGFVCCNRFGKIDEKEARASGMKYEDFIVRKADSLSLLRANVIKAHLKRNSIDTTRIRCAGYGFRKIGTRPMHANRVEVRAVVE